MNNDQCHGNGKCTEKDDRKPSHYQNFFFGSIGLEEIFININRYNRSQSVPRAIHCGHGSRHHRGEKNANHPCWHVM